MFAQTAPVPTRGSWDGVKTVPPGDKVEVTLRNGQTLKGRLINISDTVLTLANGKNTTDVPRADSIKIHRSLRKSATRSTMVGLGVGAGIGGLAGGLGGASAGGSDELGWPILIVGTIGAAIGALTGYIIGSRNQRELIYETR
jgi:hypothetical protein